MDKCRTDDPELLPILPNHRVACHLVTDEIVPTAVVSTEVSYAKSV
jgi:hypothetical protein